MSMNRNEERSLIGAAPAPVNSRHDHSGWRGPADAAAAVTVLYGHRAPIMIGTAPPFSASGPAAARTEESLPKFSRPSPADRDLDAGPY